MLIVTPAEELLALVILPVASLLGISGPAVELAVWLRSNRGNPISMTARITTDSSLCTSSSCEGDYIIGELGVEDPGALS